MFQPYLIEKFITIPLLSRSNRPVSDFDKDINLFIDFEVIVNSGLVQFRFN